MPEVSARLSGILKRLAAVPVEHPAVVPLLDAGLEGTTAYLAMEYIAAETLDVGLRRLAPAPIETAGPLIRQVAEAVEAARAVGIAHGALHPRDIFVLPATGESPDEPVQVRVSGFGLAEVLEDLRIAVPLRRPYIAPEREVGGHWDIRADVYSLAVIAHEVLTGRPPTGSAEQDCELPPDTPLEQRMTIRRALTAALAVDPEQRFSTPLAFWRALTTGAAPEAPGVTPPLPWPADTTDVEAEMVHGAGAVPVAAPMADDEPIAAEPEPEFDDLGEPEPEPEEEPELEPVPEPATTAAHRMWPQEPEAPAGARRVPAETRPPFFAAVDPPRPTGGGTMSRVLGQVILLVVGIALGTGLGYWLRGPAPAPASVADVPLATSATKAPVDEPIGTDVAVTDPPKAAPASAPAPVVEEAAPPAATRGRLLVRSVPSGATVSINGRGRGTTPATIRDLPFGTHTIAVSRVGYRSREERVTIGADRPAREVTIELPAAATSRDAGTGSLLVETRPAGATIAIDGNVIGRSPMRVPSLAAGPYTIRVSLAGYRTVTTSVVVRAGQQTPVKVSLEIQ